MFLEIWWFLTIPQHMVIILLLVSEKCNGFYVQTDGCPCDDSSSTVQQHKAELKKNNKI